jgi:predicted nucleic acid-binding protein
LAAESLGLRVHGTIGLIVRGMRRGRRTPAETKSILEQTLTRSTLHVSRSLLSEVLRHLPEG